jgi:hypothetical protein
LAACRDESVAKKGKEGGGGSENCAERTNPDGWLRPGRANPTSHEY